MVNALVASDTEVFAAGSVLWRSSDGAMWTTVELPREGPANVAALAVRGDVVVAADASTGLWRSSTALAAWEQGDLPDGASPDAVAAVGTGFAAIGYLGGKRTTWTSPDGLAWMRIPGPPAAEALSVGQDGGVMVATDSAVYSLDRDVWREVGTLPETMSPNDARRVTDLVAGRDVIVVSGCGGAIQGAAGWPAVWVVVADAATTVRLPGPSEGCVTSLAFDGTRFLAGGATTDGAATWTSADGRTWAQLDPDAPAFQVPLNAVGGSDAVPLPTLWIRDVAFAPGGALVAGGTQFDLLSVRGRLWSLRP